LILKGSSLRKECRKSEIPARLAAKILAKRCFAILRLAHPLPCRPTG
jgi:hypothetical protein